MRSRVRSGSVAIYCLLAVGIGRADDLDEFRQCAAIDEDASRLACYDRAMTRQSLSDDASGQGPVDEAPVPTMAPPAATAENLSSAVPIAPVVESASSAEPLAPAAASTPSAEQVTQVAEAPADSAAPIESDPAEKTLETFGLPEDPPEEQAESPSTSDELTALVVEVTRRARGEHVVVLDNGQVWEQEFASSYFPVKPADTVTIRKRRFSGYLLVTGSGRGYGVKRVR